jgi:hypothetical protein
MTRGIIFSADKKAKWGTIAFFFVMFAVLLWLTIEAGIQHDTLFSTDSFIVIGLWIFIMGSVFYAIDSEKIELSESELKYRNNYLLTRRLKLSDITAIHVTYGEKMARLLRISTKDGKAKEARLVTWNEDNFVKLFEELKRRGLSIDFDDRYDNAIDAVGTPEYEKEKKKVQKIYSKDVGQWALWTIIITLAPLAFLMLLAFFSPAPTVYSYICEDSTHFNASFPPNGQMRIILNPENTEARMIPRVQTPENITAFDDGITAYTFVAGYDGQLILTYKSSMNSTICNPILSGGLSK